MSNKNYTPGPWEFKLAERSKDSTTFAEINTEDMGKIYVAKTLSHMMISEEEALANSKLIACAPEMLEALLSYTKFTKLARMGKLEEASHLFGEFKKMKNKALKKAGAVE